MQNFEKMRLYPTKSTSCKITSLKWLTVAMSFPKIRERLARDKRETRERLERD